MPEAFVKPKLYTVEEAAKVMEQSESWVYAMIGKGLLKARLRRGTTRGYVMTVSDLQEFYATAYETVGKDA